MKRTHTYMIHCILAQQYWKIDSCEVLKKKKKKKKKLPFLLRGIQKTNGHILHIYVNLSPDHTRPKILANL